MKIHYKTILVTDEKKREFYGDEQYFILHEGKGWQSPIKADICCETMKQALASDVFYIQEVGNKDNTEWQIGLLLYTDDKCEGVSTWYYHSLKYCPFCAEKIEYVEDYKAKTVRKNVKIPEKIIESRTESRDVEVKIK
jgi:hypothetical protein